MKGKLIKKIERKIAVFIVSMMVLHPLFLVGIVPQKVYAANYEAPAGEEGEQNNHTGSYYCIDERFDNDGCGMHLEESETVHVSGFELSDVDNNAIKAATLKMRYKTGPAYNGTSALQYSADGVEFTDSTIVPTQTGEYVIESFDLYALGLDTKAELSSLNAKITNNSPLEEVASIDGVSSLSIVDNCDLIIDYLWIDLATNELPEVTFSSTPDKNSNSMSNDLAWGAQDDTTSEFDIMFSYRVDAGDWSSFESDYSDVSLGSLDDGDHTFDLRAKDDDENMTSISYDWTVDTTAPSVTVDDLLTNDNTPKVTGTQSDLLPPEEVEEASVQVVTEPTNGSGVDSITVNVNDKDYTATVNEDGTWSVVVDPQIVGPSVSVSGSIGLVDGAYNVEVSALDKAGNVFSKIFEGVLKVDTVSTSPVSNLVSTSGDSKVDLSWSNPTDVDFAGVRIVRNGVEISTSLSKATSYSDTTAVNGTAYVYDVYAYDNAGNKSAKVSVNAKPTAPTLATAVVALSVVVPTSAITTEQFPVQENGEIKAATKEEEVVNAKDTEVKEDRKIPVWGILFLLILAAIGGYLFYVQNPDNFNSSNGKK